MTMKRSLNLLLALMLGLTLASCDRQDSDKPRTRFVTIGTGGLTGVYYPTGAAIAKMVNAKSETYGLKATAESTGGSVYNVNAILSGDLQFGIAQSDKGHQAYQGQGDWKSPQTELRSLFSIHPEAVTLLASEVSGIQSIADLKGKRVNLGNPGSGQLGNSLDVLAAFGLSKESIRAEYVKAVEAPGLLQDERIDAFFYTVGHPNGNIKEATSGRIKVRLIPLEGPQIEALIAERPYYAEAVIDKAHYPSALGAEKTSSFGVKATLLSSAQVDEALAYALTKEVFTNLEAFKEIHPAFAGLTKEKMLQGLSAPLHPGALKYYREAGMTALIPAHLR